LLSVKQNKTRTGSQKKEKKVPALQIIYLEIFLAQDCALLAPSAIE